jgi:uridine kinase
MEKPFLILIAGGSGSGKTTAAKQIVEQSGKKRVLLISIDNYYKDLRNLKMSARKKVNFDNPNSIDWVLLKKDILSLLDNKTINLPVYSFKSHTRTGYKKTVPKKIIVIEGIFSLYDAEINGMSNLRLFVDTPPDIRLIRRMERDIKERGRTPTDVIERWLSTVKPMHDEFIEPTKSNAHVIIPEDPEGGLRSTAIELIETKIKSILH